METLNESANRGLIPGRGQVCKTSPRGFSQQVRRPGGSSCETRPGRPANSLAALGPCRARRTQACSCPLGQLAGTSPVDPANFASKFAPSSDSLSGDNDRLSGRQASISSSENVAVFAKRMNTLISWDGRVSATWLGAPGGEAHATRALIGGCAALQGEPPHRVVSEALRLKAPRVLVGRAVLQEETVPKMSRLKAAPRVDAAGRLDDRSCDPVCRVFVS